jgi:hypothetical protein
MQSLVRAAVFMALLGTGVSAARAEQSVAVQVTSDVTYELLARWDADRLNRILQTDTPAFAGIAASFTPARNAVRLYRISYASVIPEMGNKPTVASGLLAVPDTDGTSFPTVSYQHGTVYGRLRPGDGVGKPERGSDLHRPDHPSRHLCDRGSPVEELVRQQVRASTAGATAKSAVMPEQLQPAYAPRMAAPVQSQSASRCRGVAPAIRSGSRVPAEISRLRRVG